MILVSLPVHPYIAGEISKSKLAVLFNPDHVVVLAPSGAGTLVVTTAGLTYYAALDPSEVAEALELGTEEPPGPLPDRAVGEKDSRHRR